MISCYFLMAINLFNFTVCGIMGIYGTSFFGATHAQFSLFAILVKIGFVGFFNKIVVM